MKLLQYMITGLAIGFVITTACFIYAIGLNEFSIQLLAWLVASLVYGAASYIFSCESIGTLPSSCIHFCICLSITLFNVYMLYRPYTIIVLTQFICIYVLIYIVFYCIERKKVKQLNRKLQKKYETTN